MYSSRGGNSYQQQGYGGQSSYGQNSTSAYPGSSSTGPDASSQLGMTSRHQSLLAAAREQDIGGYRSHPSATAPYGGQYSSLYGAGSLSSTQQVSALTAKGTQSTAAEARGAYGSLRPNSPRYSSNEYVPSTSLGYTLKTDRLLAEKIPDYTSIDRRQYGDRQSAYMTRDLPSDATGRYSDSAGYAHHQTDVYDRMDQAVLREQILKSQSMQTASHDTTVRQADYLAARAGNLRHPPQEVDPYTGRGDAGRSSYNTQSILGAAPQRNVESLLYSQGSTNPGYGVSLPPGRDYGLGKGGLHSSALESDFSATRLRIDDRKDERGGGYMRDESRQRERLLERERERERDREKEKERERRQREREREQERERERKRVMERERERELLQRRRALEVRRERTPVRASKDRHASVLMSRDSPRVGSLHRLRSPVKRREYVCKVHASRLVDVERDFLSVDKCYSKLYVSPDFSKLVVNWPREDLKLSFHTPVSFEHDFVEEGNLVEQKEPSLKLVDVQTRSSPSGYRTVWNAKVILMSGLSRSASEELSSDKLSDDRVPHMCNLLRFAVLRKDRSFMAIGGPWDPVDGPDPSVDASSLIQTVIRYARDVTQLDLRSCKLWNRFLEVHYDRIGTDGLFSHKEITVLFVPDLSDCLPLLDAWREQWLSHKKAVAERERQSSLKREKEKSKERKDDLRDKEGTTKEVKRADKSDKQKESAASGQVVESIKEESESILVKGKEAESASAQGGVKKLNKEDSVATVGESNAKTEEVENSSIQETKKPVKKKIVKRIIKQKVVSKKSIEGSDSKNVEKTDEAVVNKNVKLEVSGEKDGSPAENKKAKVVAKKKVVKKVVGGNPVQTEEKKSVESGGNNANLQDASQDKADAKPDSGEVSKARGVPVKKKIIKKIIKRVPKKKIANVAVSDGNEVNEKVGSTDVVGNDVKKTIEVNNSGEPKGTSDPQPETKIERKADGVKQEEGAVGEKKSSDKKVNPDAEKQSVSPKDNVNSNEKERSKEKEKDPKDKKSDVKDETKRKSSKEVERKKSEEPPRHPGIILQTKSTKDSKVHSLSLSLDSLLDYTDKDVEETAFELSLFAESLYEMLQYQMGSRIFAFLEKLRVKFVLKRNQRKRQREEADAKKRSSESQSKRLKSESENTKPVIKTEDGPNDEKPRDKAEKMDVDEKAAAEDSKPLNQEKKETVEEGIDEDDVIEEVEEEVEEEEEEDPEEDLEEDDEEMQERSPQNDASAEKKDDINSEEEKKVAPADEVKDGASEEKMKNNATSGKEEKSDPKLEEEKAAEKASGKEKDAQKSGSSKEVSKEKNVKGKDAKEKAPRKEYIVDKPVLEAFRFFDRNRAGYVRLEDMRLILHSLGKYHSHRDIKELAQSALLESSTGRDDRILYEKLVKKVKE